MTIRVSYSTLADDRFASRFASRQLSLSNFVGVEFLLMDRRKVRISFNLCLMLPLNQRGEVLEGKLLLGTKKSQA